MIKYIQIGLINNVFSMKYKFSIIIPTYNEKKNLEHLINKIKKNLKKLIYEIIIVDDNSNDGSKNILKNIKSKNKKFNYFIRKNNKKDLCKSVIIGITKVKYENITKTRKHKNIRVNRSRPVCPSPGRRGGLRPSPPPH